MCFLTTVASAAFVCEDLFVHVQTNSTAEYAKALARVFHHAQVGIWFKRLGESQGSIDIVDSVAQSAVRIEINRAKNHSRKTDWHALDVAETKRSISLLGEHLFWYDKDAVVVEANQHQTRVIAERNGAPEELLHLITPNWTIGLAAHESLHNFEQDSWRSLRWPIAAQNPKHSYDPPARIRLNNELIEISHRIESVLSNHFSKPGTQLLPNNAVIQRIVADVRAILLRERASWNDLRVVAIRESTASFVEMMAIAAARGQALLEATNEGTFIATAYSVRKQKLNFERKTRVNESSIYIGYGFGADLLFLASARGISQRQLAETFERSPDPFGDILDIIVSAP